jgi:hypothetical protein
MSITVRGDNAKGGIVVPFFGRCAVVPHTSPVFLTTKEKLIKITNSVVVTATGTGHKDWKALEDDLKALARFVMDPHRNIRVYQLELIEEGLLPYLGSLKGRMHVDSNRFAQIGEIIHAIIDNHEEDHPAMVLEAVDGVVSHIRSTSHLSLWRSELLTTLEAASNKQWRPIVADNRRLLRNYGGKLIMLGLVSVVGWPVAFLYPLYRLSMTLLAIVQEWEKSKRLTRQGIFDLVKTVAMLMASMQVLSIMTMYASMGYTCLAAGAAALTVSSSDTLIKNAAPIMAPHLAQLDQLMTAVGNADVAKMLHSMSRSSGSPMDSAPIISDRVEELPDDAASRPQMTGANHGAHNGTAGQRRSGDARHRTDGNGAVGYSEEDLANGNQASAPFSAGIRKRF